MNHLNDALWLAVAENNFPEVKRLLAQGANVQLIAPDGRVNN